MDNFNTLLESADSLLSEKFNLSLKGSDFEEILANEAVFSQYVDQLTEGFTDASEKANIENLMENTRKEILTESSLSGIAPFASLTMPLLVKLWARLTMTEALPTEPVQVPAFTVTWLKPVILGHDGQKYQLPESINAYTDSSELTGKRRLVKTVKATDGKIAAFDLLTASGVTEDEIKKHVAIARNFALTGAVWSDSYDVDTKKTGALVKFSVNDKMTEDTNDNIFGEVTYVTGVDEGVPTQATDTITARVDHEAGTLTVISLSGKLQSVEIRGYVDEEQHTFATQVSFDMTKEEIQVPTASHIEASLPFEFLQDVNAMYSVDGLSQVTETMSSLIQQQVDLDLIQFIEEAYQSTNAMHSYTFDAVPAADFAFGATAWRQELKSLIDMAAQAIRQDYHAYDAKFAIVGNPADLMLLEDVSWSHGSMAGQLSNGIPVTYSEGTLSGVAAYKVVASDLIAKGKVKIIALPQRADYKTLVYYPYTFNVVRNYSNSQNNALPSLTMSKRYTTHTFVPMIGEIQIKHNNGEVYSR